MIIIKFIYNLLFTTYFQQYCTCFLTNLQIAIRLDNLHNQSMDSFYSEEEYYQPQAWINAFHINTQRKCEVCSEKSASLLASVYGLLKSGNYNAIRSMKEVQYQFLHLCGEQIYLGDCFVHKYLMKKRFPQIQKMEKIQDKVRSTCLNHYSASNKLPKQTQLFKYSGSPININVGDDLKMQIKGLMKNGAPYKGQFKVEYNYCNSVQNSQNISNYPSLIDQNDRKMVSANMFTFRITDEQGNIIYSKEPTPAQQKFPNGFSIEMMEQYRVFQTNCMDQNQRWVQVGDLQVNAKNKTFKYSIPNKSDDQVVKNIQELIKIRQKRLKAEKQDQFQSTLKNLFQEYRPYSKNKYQKFTDIFPNLNQKVGKPTYITTEIRQVYFSKKQQQQAKDHSKKLMNIFSQRLVPFDVIKNKKLYKRFYEIPNNFMLSTLKKYQDFGQTQANIFAEIVQSYNEKIHQSYEVLKNKINRLENLEQICQSQLGNSCDRIRLDCAKGQLQIEKQSEQFSCSTLLMNEIEYSYWLRRHLIKEFQRITKFIFTEPNINQTNEVFSISAKLYSQIKDQDNKSTYQQEKTPDWQRNILNQLEWCTQQPYLGVWMPREGLKIPKSRGKQLLIKEKENYKRYQERLLNSVEKRVQYYMKNQSGKENLFCQQYLINKKRNKDIIISTKQNLRKQFTLLSSNSKRIQSKLQELFELQQKIQLQIDKEQMLNFIYRNFENTRKSNSSSINVMKTYQQNIQIITNKDAELLIISNGIQIPIDNQKLSRFTNSLKGGDLWDDIRNSPTLMKQFLARNGIQNINIDYLFPDTIALIKRRLTKQQIEDQQRLYAQKKKREAEELAAQQQLDKYKLTRQNELSNIQTKRKSNKLQSQARFKQKSKDIEGTLRGTNSSLSTNESNDDEDYSASTQQQKWKNILNNVRSRINQFDNTTKKIDPITKDIKTQLDFLKKNKNQLQNELNKKVVNLRPISDMINGLQRKQKLTKQEQQSLLSLMGLKRPLSNQLNQINNKVKQNQSLMRQTLAVQKHLKSLQQISSVIKKYKLIQQYTQRSIVNMNQKSSSTAQKTQKEKKLSEGYKNISNTVRQLQKELKKIQTKSNSLQFNRAKLQLEGISNKQIKSLQQNYNDLKEIYSSLRQQKGGKNYQQSFDRNLLRWKELSQDIKK